MSKRKLNKKYVWIEQFITTEEESEKVILYISIKVPASFDKNLIE